MTSEIKFKTSDVMPYLQTVASITNPKNTLPILACIMFKVRTDAEGNAKLVMVASDSETTLSMGVSITSLSNHADFNINAKDIVTSLRTLGDKEITLLVDDEKHLATFKYDKGQFTLPCMDGDFPEMKEVFDGKAVVLSKEQLVKAIDKCEYAVGDDDIRPIMSGVHFDFFRNGMVAVGTDGRKLVRYRDVNVTHEEDSVYSFTLNKRPAALLASILKGMQDGESVHVDFTESHISFLNANYGLKLTSRLIEGNYPNYNSVIPKDNTKLALVSRVGLIDALKHIQPLSNTSSELVRMDFKGNVLSLSCEDIDFSKSANEDVDCTLQGDDISIGFKTSIVMQCLQNMDCENVYFAMSEPSRACIVYEANGEDSRDRFLSLLMPMMLN